MKLYVIANCQTQSFEVLARQMLAGATVGSTDFLDTAAHTEDAQKTALFQMEQADIILIQPGGKGIYDAQRVKQRFASKTFIIAGLYFRGLHPDSCYVGAYEDRFQNPSLYHSVVVLDAFKRGRSAAWAVKAFNLDNFERLGLLDAWDSSLDEMRRRDQDLDFPVANLIDHYCREFPGFFSLNHPSLPFLHSYLAPVLRQMGLRVQPMDSSLIRDPMATYDVVPVHDFIAEYYGLSYRTTQHWMIHHLGKKYIDRADYVQRFYAEYRKADPAKLFVHSPIDLVASLEKQPHLGKPMKAPT